MSAEQVKHLKRLNEVRGMMKDETHGIVVKEYVGLRAKMYSLLTLDALCECSGACNCERLCQKNTAK
eukprot:46567-Eustigmatos_ZCMA.PRE.1